jgi:hypothetical protein
MSVVPGRGRDLRAATSCGRDFDRRPAADDHPVFRVDRTGSA